MHALGHHKFLEATQVFDASSDGYTKGEGLLLASWGVF